MVGGVLLVCQMIGLVLAQATKPDACMIAKLWSGFIPVGPTPGCEALLKLFGVGIVVADGPRVVSGIFYLKAFGG